MGDVKPFAGSVATNCADTEWFATGDERDTWNAAVIFSPPDVAHLRDVRRAFSARYDVESGFCSFGRRPVSALDVDPGHSNPTLEVKPEGFTRPGKDEQTGGRR
jgi:hypothetical protein